MDFQKIGDTLIDIKVVNSKKTALEVLKYKDTVKLLGYLSKMKNYEREHDRVKNKLYSLRKQILREYDSSITQDDKKYLLINPILCKEYNQGVNSFQQLKNYMIYQYRRQLYLILETESFNSKLKSLLDSIIKQDTYFDIYNETIGSFMEQNEVFLKIIKKKYSEYIYF